MEVPLRVHEPDADERHAEVARFLAVIAGEHAETAGVDRERLVQRELGGEVGNRSAELRKAARPPGVARAARLVERGDSPVVQLEERGVGVGLFEPRARHEAQHAHRVVRGLPPERVIEAPEHLAGFGVPAPPQVDGEVFEAADAFRKGRQVRVSVHWSHAPTSAANFARSMFPPETTATTLPPPPGRA